MATSTVYLTRNLGNVAGVALSSAILQNYLVVKLPVLLKHVPNKAEVSSPVLPYFTGQRLMRVYEI